MTWGKSIKSVTSGLACISPVNILVWDPRHPRRRYLETLGVAVQWCSWVRNSSSAQFFNPLP